MHPNRPLSTTTPSTTFSKFNLCPLVLLWLLVSLLSAVSKEISRIIQKIPLFPIAEMESWKCLSSKCMFTIYLNFDSFPQCWDGENLDSADYMSHMKYQVNGNCPSSHPVLLPRVQIKLRFPVPGGPGTSLSSGNGLSGHADFVSFISFHEVLFWRI